MKTTVLFILIILVSGLISCKQVIDINVSSASSLLVIEGNVTDQLGTQTVTLSRSVDYNSTNVFPTVSGAVITINESTGVNYKLTETSPGTYIVNRLKGKTGEAYTLNVVLNGQSYTATSIMPPAVPLDSLTLVEQAFGSRTVKTVAVNFRDPPGISNQYKFVMYINGVQVKRIFTQNDVYTDGNNIVIMLYQDIDLKKGDRVDVDMQCIDAPIYNYWNSLSNQGGNGPQNSATPANPPSNISNNALGYFSAHTIQRKSTIIP